MEGEYFRLDLPFAVKTRNIYIPGLYSFYLLTYLLGLFCYVFHRGCTSVSFNGCVLITAISLSYRWPVIHGQYTVIEVKFSWIVTKIKSLLERRSKTKRSGLIAYYKHERQGRDTLSHSSHLKIYGHMFPLYLIDNESFLNSLVRLQVDCQLRWCWHKHQIRHRDQMALHYKTLPGNRGNWWPLASAPF